MLQPAETTTRPGVGEIPEAKTKDNGSVADHRVDNDTIRKGKNRQDEVEGQNRRVDPRTGGRGRAKTAQTTQA